MPASFNTTEAADNAIQSAEVCTGVGCNSICDPAWGANCLPGLTCIRVASGENRCRSMDNPERADCGYNGGGECGDSCDPSQGRNCREGLICKDDEQGNSRCVAGEGMTCPNEPATQCGPPICPPGLCFNSLKNRCE